MTYDEFHATYWQKGTKVRCFDLPQAWTVIGVDFQHSELRLQRPIANMTERGLLTIDASHCTVIPPESGQ